ncbi:MAG: caspase family protein [Verrucomicrobiota bacterium]
MASMIYLVFGSQIGNPFVKKNLVPGRRLHVPGSIRHFIHLFNDHDKVLTNRIRIRDPRFIELNTYFDHRCHNLHHCPEGYFEHPATIQHLWEPVARQLAARRRSTSTTGPRPLKLSSLSKLTQPRKRPPARKRAFLVGINDYPNPADRLEGCVNDVFLVSSVLQECGFPANHIRVLLDERATTPNILTRIEWLLEDARPGDQLVFYFSGHGARSPKYNADMAIEGYEERLVTHDFDWSDETGITDQMINGLYSQLPYGVHLTFIFDCCHSGGMHRNGTSRIRGLNPPDDIRHRAMQWDTQKKIWVPRAPQAIMQDFSKNDQLNRQFMGQDLCTFRLGCDIEQRAIPQKDYTRLKKASPSDDDFPFLPVIIYACKDSEYAYEYRHGVESFGAFSYVMAATLRKQGAISYNELVAETRRILEKELGLTQTPDCLGPSQILSSNIPHID